MRWWIAIVVLGTSLWGAVACADPVGTGVARSETRSVLRNPPRTAAPRRPSAPPNGAGVNALPLPLDEAPSEEVAPATAATPVTKTFPYVAYVAPKQTQVYSGPGNAYYATDNVTRGMKVEVLRELSGWLAIRPVIGSFCWLPASAAELTEEPDMAQIISDDTPAWIGTRLDKEAEHVWQVQLNRGDRVKILGTKRRPAVGDKPAEVWYRIEPPAAEYRFIKADDVTTEEELAEAVVEAEKTEKTEKEVAAKDTAQPREFPAALADKAKAIAAVMEKLEAASENLSNQSAQETAATPAGEEVTPAQFVPRDRTARNTPAAKSLPVKNPANVAPEKSSPFKEVGGTPGRTDTPRVASVDRLAPTDPNTLLSASSRFDDKISDLELQLAVIATRDPREWQLQPLKTQAEELVAAGTTTLERGRARLMLDKVSEFENLARRSQTVADLPRTAGLNSVNETSLPRDTTPMSSKQPGLKIPDGVAYDGAGWLKPAYSRSGVSPPYAIVDADGKLLQFVTPSPGLNLNRYVGKPVGIFGQKSRLEKPTKADHVTASKIVDLTQYQK